MNTEDNIILNGIIHWCKEISSNAHWYISRVLKEQKFNQDHQASNLPTY